MDNSSTCISEFRAEDYDAWKVLWNENNQGHINEQVTESTWARLIDPDHPVKGLAARLEDGQLAGLVHYILHPTTGHIEPVCYMQDVYVRQEHRRKGIAKQMVETLANLGQEQSWARLYWLAEKNNIAAQNLYKTIGLKLDFTLHIMPL